MTDAPWFEEFPAPITVTDEAGTIVAMNAASRQTFAADGGGALVGRSVFDCHPEPALTRTRELYARREPNHYTVRSHGVRRIIHQFPWTRDGAFAGFVEISVVIPEELPHHDRDAARAP
jgi:transcriptional regulator with PAS, ATPase and Fis domain